MNDTLCRFAKLALVCVAVGLIITASCKDTKLESAWVSGPIVIDGRVPDWNGVTSHFIEESEVSVAFANDSSHLSILLRTRDPQVAGIIRRSGIVLWINAEGKRDEDFVLRYRGGPTREEMRSMMAGNQRRQNDRETQFTTPDTGKPSFTCFVKDRIVEMEIPMDGSAGPAVAFSLDAGFFTYEFSLPLHESALRSYGLAALPGQTISVGAHWGGSERRMNPGHPGSGGIRMGPPTGDGGDFGGGGGRGGGRRGGMGGERSKYQQQPAPLLDTNMKLILALSGAVEKDIR